MVRGCLPHCGPASQSEMLDTSTGPMATVIVFLAKLSIRSHLSPPHSLLFLGFLFFSLLQPCHSDLSFPAVPRSRLRMTQRQENWYTLAPGPGSHHSIIFLFPSNFSVLCRLSPPWGSVLFLQEGKGVLGDNSNFYRGIFLRLLGLWALVWEAPLSGSEDDILLGLSIPPHK